MGFRTGAYAKVWKIENKGNYSVGQISISRKNKNTDQYEVEFQDGFTRFVGNAHNDINSIDFPDKGGLTIKLTSCDVTNNYSKEKKMTYTNYVIFGFETPNGELNTPAAETSNTEPKPAEQATEEDSFAEADDDLPF